MNYRKFNKFKKTYNITNSNQLYELSKKNNIKLDNISFINKDEIYKPGYYIFNLGINTGTHFVSCVITNNYTYYCDSFGVSPPDRLNTVNNNFYYNDYKEIQKYDEYLCGIYSLMFLKYMNENSPENHNDYINNFNNYLSKFNDTILMH